MPEAWQASIFPDLSLAMKTCSVALAILTVTGRVAAWGSQGHETVGYVAMQFLASNAKAFVEKTVDAKFSHSLGPAAPWADTFRLSHKWSEPFHFIDAEDNPTGGSCSVDQHRDCPGKGCILTAIANYTQRVNDPSLSDTEVQQALYFLDHFVGDIGQPLHVEAYEVGGNEIHVKCNGKSTNLHAAWDTGMLVTQLDSTYGGSVENYANALADSIKHGEYKDAAPGWIECSSISDTFSSRHSLETEMKDLLETDQSSFTLSSPLSCPLVWAREANRYVCSQVFTYQQGHDLCEGEYLDSSLIVINEQIAKQGYRLAAWLNVIFDGSPTLP